MERRPDPGLGGRAAREVARPEETSVLTSRTALTATAVVGAASMGGVFGAFSTFVMPALGRLVPTEAIAAMQAINRAAPTPLFMVPLFGTAALGVGLAVQAARHLDEPGRVPVVVGAVVYLVAVVGLTAAYHVPRNDALATVDPTTVDAASTWASFTREWTRANHVRALGGLAAAGCWALALVRA
jgi:uncharacterized membrane protein